MKSKIFPALAATIILMILSAGCASGIPESQYQDISQQLTQAKEQISKLNDEIEALREQSGAGSGELKAANDEIAALQKEINDLKERYVLAGDTPAETAENIVRYYHETHVYSTYDLFVCSDMASEVWNMLKAQGINSVIVVGNKDAGINNIIECNHAWVLAEVAPGERLALETTGGFTVPRSQNALYYQGWYFKTPSDLKTYNQLFREYNLRVDIHNDLVKQAKEVQDQHNAASSQTDADRFKAVYEKLVALVTEQETLMNNVMSRINELATRLQ